MSTLWAKFKQLSFFLFLFSSTFGTKSVYLALWIGSSYIVYFVVLNISDYPFHIKAGGTFKDPFEVMTPEEWASNLLAMGELCCYSEFVILDFKLSPLSL